MNQISNVSLLIVLCNFFISNACDGNANEFIVEVLANARQDLNHWIPLPDVHIEKINVWNINVWGFGSLKRGANSCFESDEQANLTVRATFVLFNVRGSARGSHTEDVNIFGLKIASIPLYFGVNAIIPYIRLRLGISSDLNASINKIIDFEFEEFDDAEFSIRLNGFLKIFNVVANLLADRFGNIELKPKAKALIYDSFENALKKFDKFDLISQIDN